MVSTFLYLFFMFFFGFLPLFPYQPSQLLNLAFGRAERKGQRVPICLWPDQQLSWEGGGGYQEDKMSSPKGLMKSELCGRGS